MREVLAVLAWVAVMTALLVLLRLISKQLLFGSGMRWAAVGVLFEVVIIGLWMCLSAIIVSMALRGTLPGTRTLTHEEDLNQCPLCQYDLTDIIRDSWDARVCPECGEVIESRRPKGSGRSC